MSIESILDARHSVRGFTDRPVDAELIKAVFAKAQRSPSNCNTQPWQVYVASGETRDKLAQSLQATVMSGNPPNPKFDWAARYEGVYRERQIGAAVALYEAMGIGRDDKMARNIAMLRNWDFFGAPHAAFFTMPVSLGVMGAVDVGIYAQTLSLLLEENGIQSCMQGALGQFPEPIESMFDIPEDFGILFGMSFGYVDPEHQANKARTTRVPAAEPVVFRT
ncbi:MAG: nitroreductase [Pseudomonadota bacterium]